MADPGAPLGFDVSTTLVGSGLTLVLSGIAMRYGEQVTNMTVAELYATGGGAMLAIGVLLGLVLVLRGMR